MTADLPTGVLSQQLGDLIAGRRVRAALFTTFAFDPGFFELHVLPLLFPIPFRQADKVKRIQLEDALRDVAHLAVYFDQTAIARDCEPAQLDYRRIDVRRRTGVFHPKIVCLLVEKPREEDEEHGGPHLSLLVGVLSANLTRAGWWENVECAHFEEISDRDVDDSRVSFRTDLLGLLGEVRRAAGAGEDQGALEAVRHFLLHRTQKRGFSNVSSQGRWFTRIFYGQKRFSDWLCDLRLDRTEWNLEVVSPYFPAAGVTPLAELIELLEPRETRIHLPVDADGSALVSAETYEQVQELGAVWSALPTEFVSRGRGADAARQPPRFVHAKIYRLWGKGVGEVLIIGSVNLTDAAHSHRRAGNLEAAWLVDTFDSWPQRWWLRPVEWEPEHFSGEAEGEDAESRDDGLDLSLRFDWGSLVLEYRLRQDAAAVVRICSTSGTALEELRAEPGDTWQLAPTALAQALHEHLASSSLVVARSEEREWLLLVREENVAHRPSILSRLTPEEILEYWSLLTPEQRAALLERAAARELGGAQLEGLELVVDRLRGSQTLFDRFAGVFHAFGCLRRFIALALEEGRSRDAEARLFGAKYDSLPSLLEKELEADPEIARDPVMRYVTFLCAQQLRAQVERDHPEFVAACGDRTRHLEGHLRRLDEVRAAIPLDDADGVEFVSWYEEAFLGGITQP